MEGLLEEERAWTGLVGGTLDIAEYETDYILDAETDLLSKQLTEDERLESMSITNLWMRWLGRQRQASVTVPEYAALFREVIPFMLHRKPGSQPFTPSENLATKNEIARLKATFAGDGQ